MKNKIKRCLMAGLPTVPAYLAVVVGVAAVFVANNQLNLARHSLNAANAVALSLEASRLIDDYSRIISDSDGAGKNVFFERFMHIFALSIYLNNKELVDPIISTSLMEDFCNLYQDEDFVAWWRDRQSDAFMNRLYPEISYVGESCDVD